MHRPGPPVPVLRAAEASQSPPDGDDEDSGDPTDSADDGNGQDEDGDSQPGGDDGRRRPGRRTARARTPTTKTTPDTSDTPPSHDPSGTGEVMDAEARAGDDGESGEAPVDITAEEQAWDEAMHQALNIARAEGKVPGRVEETIQQRACEHARLADPAAALHDRRREPRL